MRVALILLLLALVLVTAVENGNAGGMHAIDLESPVKQSDEDIAILQAAVEGSLEKIQQALNLGADIEARDGDVGNTPLIWASFHGHYGAVSFLLKRGASVGALSRDSHKTALIMAAYSGHVAVIVLLLDKGALVNEANSRGDTPLAIAAYMNHTSCVRALLDHRASLTRRTIKHHYTPLHLAAYRGYTNVLAELLPFYTWEAAAADDAAATTVEGAPDPLLNLNARDKQGNSALLLAATQGQTSAADQLLEAGSDFCVTDKLGNTALMLAVNRGHLETATLLVERLDAGAVAVGDVAKKVALRAGERGSSSLWLVDAPNLSGQTPLGRACTKGYSPLVKLLLMRGASLAAAVMNGKSCREAALEGDFKIILGMLDEYEADRGSEGYRIEL